MNNNWTIYKHTSPSGKVYIGITSRTPKRRWAKGLGYKKCQYFRCAIDKYGWDNIKHEILFSELSELKAKSLEIDLIRHYKNLGISYNITNGGDGYLGFTPSDETKKTWSEQRRNRVLTKEWRDKISETTKGKVFRRDIIEKGVEASKKVSSKPILQYTLGGEFIREWPSMREAAKALNISSPRDLKRCCTGERKSRAGFIWKLKN